MNVREQIAYVEAGIQANKNMRCEDDPPEAFLYTAAEAAPALIAAVKALEAALKELRYSVIRTICHGLPGPSACVAPNCTCYEQNGGPVFDAIFKLFEAYFKEET